MKAKLLIVGVVTVGSFVAIHHSSLCPFHKAAKAVVVQQVRQTKKVPVPAVSGKEVVGSVAVNR